jgi:RimJ/RimL family protein N-acetyltransferase
MIPSFETARLVLRPRAAADLEACLAMDLDDEVMRYVGGRRDDPDGHRATLRQRLAYVYPDGLGYWSIFARARRDRFLGWVALVPHADDDGTIEIGWRIRRAAWGNGFAAEAAAAVIRHAVQTLGLERIVADIHPDNAQSIRVAEKLGLRLVGSRTYLGAPCKSFEMIRRGVPA